MAFLETSAKAIQLLTGLGSGDDVLSEIGFSIGSGLVNIFIL